MLYFLKITSFNIITIFLLISSFIFCAYLLLRIKDLKEQIDYLNTKYMKEVDIKRTYNDKNIIPIKTISNNRVTASKNRQTDELYKKEYPKKEKNKANNLKKENYSINNTEFNTNDLIPIKPKDEEIYLEEVSKKIQKEIDSKPIELTKYEQEEESNAIISYKELLDTNENNTLPSSDSDDFLEQLKKLRSSL